MCGTSMKSALWRQLSCRRASPVRALLIPSTCHLWAWAWLLLSCSSPPWALCLPLLLEQSLSCIAILQLLVWSRTLPLKGMHSCLALCPKIKGLLSFCQNGFLPWGSHAVYPLTSLSTFTMLSWKLLVTLTNTLNFTPSGFLSDFPG